MKKSVRTYDLCIDCNSRFPATKRRICYSCKQKRYKKNNPFKYAYRKLKANAKRRGKDFELTLEQFKEFCVKTDYIVGKGKSAESYHIDRIDPEKGYSVDNIQVLTNSENVKKCLQYNYNRHTRQMEFWVSRESLHTWTDDEVPF